MKKSILIPILLLVVFSCSPEEETQAPTNTVQTTTPEPAVTQYTLTVTANEGGTVSSEGGTYDEGTEVTITASANVGYRFTGWEGNSSNSESLTVTLNSNQTYQALFELTTYTLTVTVGEGGTVSSEGGEFEEGTEVTIIASPTEGYVFTGWEGNNSTSESLTVTLNSNITLNAIFKEEYNYEYNQVDLNEPPFLTDSGGYQVYGTNLVSGDIITSSDPSLFNEIEYKGIGLRPMFDRRTDGNTNVEAYLFDTSFSDGLKTEIQINPEFTLDEATVEANKYAFLIGQLPTALRKDVEIMVIHKGIEPYGGGNNGLLVHTGYTEIYESYIPDGSDYIASVVEETLLHEATHTSLDAYHYPNGGWTNSGYSEGERWIEVVENDNECYISSYARDFPYREDLAELMPLYIAVRYFPERISSELRDKILSCNINRIRYLDSQNLDMSIYED